MSRDASTPALIRPHAAPFRNLVQVPEALLLHSARCNTRDYRHMLMFVCSRVRYEQRTSITAPRGESGLTRSGCKQGTETEEVLSAANCT